MEGLRSFWAQVADVWNTGVFGASAGQIGVAILILIVAWFARSAFAHTVVRALLKLASKTEHDWDDKLVRAAAEPLKLLPVALGFYFAINVLDLQDDARTVADQVFRSLIALSIFWSLSRAVTVVGEIAEPFGHILPSAMVGWLIRIAQVALIAVGVAAVLEIWGVRVAPLLAGLGIFGVAVALGAQDLFKNLIAGAVILIERRFEPGEWIRCEGVVEGTVEEIGFRSTIVRRFDKGPVHVPNAKLADNPVINFSRMTHRRIKWIVGVEYRTTKAQLETIRAEIERYLLENDAFAKPPEVALFVRVDAFAASSIDFLIYTFTKTTNWGEWLALKEAFALEIKRIVEDAGTSFAFPSRTIYIDAGEAEGDLPASEEAFAAAEARLKKARRKVGAPKASDDVGDGA